MRRVHSDGEAPYCATISLYWQSLFYTHWACGTKRSLAQTLFATPTETGTGPETTRYLDGAVADSVTAPSSGTTTSDTTPDSSTDTSNTATKSDSISWGTVGGIVGAVAGVVGAIAAIGLWLCTKRHHSKQRAYEVERDRNFSSQELVVRRPEDVARFVRNGAGGGARGGLNVYVNEFHYHDHGGGGAVGRLT